MQHDVIQKGIHVIQYDTTRHDTTRHDTIEYDVITLFNMMVHYDSDTQYDTIRCVIVLYCIVFYLYIYTYIYCSVIYIIYIYNFDLVYLKTLKDLICQMEVS